MPIITDYVSNPDGTVTTRQLVVETLLDQPQAEARQAAETAGATNERTIGDALLAALLANQQAITQLTTWRTTGAGAGTANLTLAQVSPVLRQMADQQVAQAKQLNGLIRLVKRSLSTADLSQGVSKPAAPLS